MKINSVKLINGGLKGLKVKYALPLNKDSREFSDDTIEHVRRTPIHSELEETFGWLKGYILDICGYGADTLDKDLIDTEMVSVTYTEKGFVLTAKKSVLDGVKSTNLVTPLITEADYSEFDKVTKILDGIYAETKAYMNGDKTFNDEQLVIKFSRNDESFDEDAFKKMSKEEQKDAATKILEDLGCLIFHPEVEEEVVAEVVVKPVAEKSVDFKAEAELVDWDIKPTAKPSATFIQSEDEDDFEIVLASTPVKESTAKRKQA